MHPIIKILAGAAMISLGVFASNLYWSELVTMVKAAVGPLLVLVGVFVVWLESDELKLETEDEDRAQGLQRQFEREETSTSTTSRDYSQVLSGTVDEVKEEVRGMENPDVDALMEAERQGKNRKTVIEFLERRR